MEIFQSQRSLAVVARMKNRMTKQKRQKANTKTPQKTLRNAKNVMLKTTLSFVYFTTIPR